MRTVVIAGTHSGVGKTTAAAGIMAALAGRGGKVQGFNPENADALRIRGGMKARLKNFDGAIEDFGAAVRISPRFSRAYGDRGDTYRQMGKPDLALADYDRALEIDKKYYWFCEARGDLLRSQGKLDGAAADYRSALETAKDEAVRARLQKKLAALKNSAKE